MSAWDVYMKIITIVAGVFEILKFCTAIRLRKIGKLEYMTLAIGILYIGFAIYLSTAFAENHDIITMAVGLSWLTLIITRWRYKKKHNIED